MKQRWSRHLGKSPRVTTTNLSLYVIALNMAGSKPHFSEELRLSILHDRDIGLSWSQIAKKRNVSCSGAVAVVRKRETHGTVRDLPKSGRPPNIPAAILE